jgi:hypothetical protein
MDDNHTLHYASPIKPCVGKHPTPWGNQPCPEDVRTEPRHILITPAIFLLQNFGGIVAD